MTGFVPQDDNIMRKLLLVPVVAAVVLMAAHTPSVAPKCDDEIKLPAGFCAVVFADSVAGARHLAVARNGDVFVSAQGRGGGAGVVALRDTNADGRADVRVQYAGGFGSS